MTLSASAKRRFLHPQPTPSPRRGGWLAPGQLSTPGGLLAVKHVSKHEKHENFLSIWLFFM